MTRTAPRSSPSCTAVVGLQWGDEGKGKIVDLLASAHDAVARYNGGANAGHSVVVGGERYALHLIPSGILFPGKPAVIGNGVVVDPEALIQELDGLLARGVDTSSLVISSRAHAVMPYHKSEDHMREELMKGLRTAGSDGGIVEIGTTRRGIGPAYADKVQRACAVRMGDLLRPELLQEKIALACRLKRPLLGAAPEVGTLNEEDLLARAVKAGKRLAPMIRDTTFLLHDLLARGKSVLFEGANGTLLDVDHGTYPYVTGSSTTAAGVGPGTGVPASKIGRVVGVMKAYSTRVGSGPMPTELLDEVGQGIRDRGREYGTTTGRPRRVGWLDLVAVRYSAMINGATELAITLLDVLGGMPELMVCTAYQIDGKTVRDFPADGFDLARAKPVWERLPGFGPIPARAKAMPDLPEQARRYVDRISHEVNVPVGIVSIGPDREQTIVLEAS